MATTYRGPADIQVGDRPSLQKQVGRRLSKPRTTTVGTLTSTSAAECSSPTSSKPSPSSNKTDSTLDLLKSQPPPGYESQQKQRDNFYAQGSAYGDSKEVVDNAGSKKYSVKERISRTGTAFGKKASFRISLRGTKSQPRLSVFNVTDNTDEIDRTITEIKQKAHNDSMIALNHVTSPVDMEETQNNSMPIRRRSLFTPGLATRNPSDMLRKPPSVEEREETANALERARYYNPKLSESSPLGRIAALDLASGGRNSPISRCSTPGDLDYGHLGSKCTLRIANGVASSSPSAPSSVVNVERKASDPYSLASYYTAPEEHFNGETQCLPTQTIHRPSLDPAGRALTPQQLLNELELARASTQRNGVKNLAQSRSPLRIESHIHDSDVEEQAPMSASAVPSNEIEWERLDRTSRMAQQYIADLAESPFVPEYSVRPETPASLQATSKANEFEDELFEDNISRPNSTEPRPQRWSASYRTDSGDLVHVESTTISHSTSVTTTSTTFSSFIESRPEPRPMPEVGDSGYSSNTSLSSLSNRRKSLQIGPIIRSPSNTSQNECQPSQQLDYRGVHSSDSISTSKDLFVDHTGGKEPVARLSNRGSLVFENSIDRSRNRSPRQIINSPKVPTSKFALPIENVVATSEETQSGHFIQDSATVSPGPSSITTPTKKEKPRAKSTGPKKLQKKPRPKSLPPPVERITIQGEERKISVSKIPPVPADIFARHAQRMHEMPPLEKTVPDYRSTRQYESTVWENVPQTAPLRFPSPEQAEDKPKRRSFSGRKILPSNLSSQNSGLGDRPPISAPLKSERRERRLSRQRRSSQIDIPQISDFGDVSASLGESPYDAAFNARNSSPPKRSQQSGTQPHHLTTAILHPKSIVGMNDVEASELSRYISEFRTYYGQERAQPPTLHSNKNPLPVPPKDPPYDQGRISAHRKYFDNEQGALPGRMPYRQSAALNAPPVPSVPVKTQIEDIQSRTSRDYPNNPPDDQLNSHTQPRSTPKDWNAAKDAWAQHRKTASETVRAKPQIGVEHGIVARMSGRFESGRFEGGLAYGYEPGQGVIGSAGMRNGQSGASKKSIEWSKGYGLDLTDVPIMIAPVSGSEAR